MKFYNLIFFCYPRKIPLLAPLQKIVPTPIVQALHSTGFDALSKAFHQHFAVRHDNAN